MGPAAPGKALARQIALGAVVPVLALTGCSKEAPAAAPAKLVADEADILPSAMEASLDQRLRAYFENSGNAVLVASAPSLGDNSIEDLAKDTLGNWEGGDAIAQRGLLLLIAPSERLVRIEVGCALESVITKEAAADVIEDNILPHFSQGDMARGTMTGAEMLVTRLESQPAPEQPAAACAAAEKDAE